MSKIAQRIMRRLKMKFILKRYQASVQTQRGPLSYLAIPSNKSKSLVVVFSAFPRLDAPATYNYVMSFNDLDCNKLYILDDFGPAQSGGSYYLGADNDFFLKENVRELILSVAGRLRIAPRNIMTLGSSKGGYAALLFAIENGWGAAVAGAPQSKLGDYFLSHPSHEKYLQYITGGTSQENVDELNRHLYDVVVASSKETKVFLHVSCNDDHYENHVLPLHKHLQRNAIESKLDIADYENHSMVGKFFPDFARRCLDSWLSKCEPNQHFQHEN